MTCTPHTRKTRRLQTTTPVISHCQRKQATALPPSRLRFARPRSDAASKSSLKWIVAPIPNLQYRSGH